MEILNIVVYVIALVSYLGLLIFGCVALVRAYRNVRRESDVFRTYLCDYLTSINEKLDEIKNAKCK